MYQDDERREVMNIEEMWGQLKDILSKAGIEGRAIAEGVMDDIRSGITNGKAKPLRSGGFYPGDCNAIPGHPGSSCCRQLLVKCYNRDNLSDRLRDMIYHAGIYCPDDNKEVVFISTKWDNKSFQPHQKAIDILKRKGVKFAFVLISSNGMTAIHV